MRTLHVALGTSLAALSVPALADSCLPAFAGPQSGEGDSYEFVMTTLEPGGIANYAQGRATFVRGFIMPPGIPRPPRWMTTNDHPADLYRNIGPTLVGLAPPPKNVSGFVLPPIAISVTSAATPVITLRFLDTNKTVSLSGICSVAGVLHGTSAAMDVLIYLRRPVPVL